MRFLFKKHSQKTPGLDYDTGYSAEDPAQITIAAQRDTHFSEKIDLVRGAVDAAKEGRTRNIAAFFTSYLSFKTDSGSIRNAMSGPLDDGLSRLVGTPMLMLINSVHEPLPFLHAICGHMPPRYAQVMLDITLRIAAAESNFIAMRALLDAGANINTASGRPLAQAALNGMLDVTLFLLENGSDKNMALFQIENSDNRDTGLKTLRAAERMIAQAQKQQKEKAKKQNQSETSAMPTLRIIDKKPPQP